MNTSRSFVECDFTVRKFAGALRSEEPYNVVLIGQVVTISEFNSYYSSSENVPKSTPKVKKENRLDSSHDQHERLCLGIFMTKTFPYIRSRRRGELKGGRVGGNFHSGKRSQLKIGASVRLFG